MQSVQFMELVQSVCVCFSCCMEDSNSLALTLKPMSLTIRATAGDNESWFWLIFVIIIISFLVEVAFKSFLTITNVLRFHDHFSIYDLSHCYCVIGHGQLSPEDNLQYQFITYNSLACIQQFYSGLDAMGPSGGGHALSNPSLASRQRLRWTSELHERFVDAVGQLGGPDSQYR